MNVNETFANIEYSQSNDYLAFLVFFIALFSLNLITPGRTINQDGSEGPLKAKMPWLVIIALVGIIYGVVTFTYWPSIKPRLLSDSFPSMTEDKIYNFGYLDRTYTNVEGQIDIIPWSPIILGSLKVALVAIVETLISALIAQKKYI